MNCLWSDKSYPCTEERIAYPVHMLDGAFIFRPFVIKTESESVIVPDFQFQSDVFPEFHLQETSAAVHGAEDAAEVAFGNNDFFERESGIIKFLQAYLADIGQQVGTAAGVDEFLIELFIGYLFLAVPVFFVGESAIYRVAFLHQHFFTLAGLRFSASIISPK